MTIINRENAKRYSWGNNCDGWHFLQHDDLSIIHERMPSNTSETRHYHERSRQFFYILSGTATMELDGVIYRLEPEEGIEVPPKHHHCIHNQGEQDLYFLVISSPKSHGDRKAVDLPPTHI